MQTQNHTHTHTHMYVHTRILTANPLCEQHKRIFQLYLLSFFTIRRIALVPNELSVYAVISAVLHLLCGTT